MITIKDVQEFLKNEESCFQNPEVAKRFLQFWADLKGRVPQYMVAPEPSDLKKYWDDFLADCLTNQQTAKEMLPTARMAQYWDMVYEQMESGGFDTAGEMFAAENHKSYGGME